MKKFKKKNSKTFKKEDFTGKFLVGGRCTKKFLLDMAAQMGSIIPFFFKLEWSDVPSFPRPTHPRSIGPLGRSNIWFCNKNHALSRCSASPSAATMAYYCCRLLLQGQRPLLPLSIPANIDTAKKGRDAFLLFSSF